MPNGTIFQLIFEEILRITPNIISQYTTLQDQLLYLLLIPHVIIFLFLYSFGIWVIKEHIGLRYLLIIVAYIFIVLSGWYGQYLIPIVVNWFAIILGAAFIFFLFSRIIPPARALSFFKFGGEAGRAVHERTFGKTRKRKALEKEIERLKDERTVLNRKVRDLSTRSPPPRRAINAIEADIATIEAKIARLRREEDQL